MSRIMIVEDHLALAEQLRFRFERAGWAVIVARSIAEAERYAVQHRVDVMLLDLNQPNGRGTDLIKALRPITAVPFVVYTGEYDPAVEHEAWALGVAGYFRKGEIVEGGRIVNVVEEVTRILRSYQEGVAPTMTPEPVVDLNKTTTRDEARKRPAAVTARETIRERMIDSGVHPDEADVKVKAKEARTARWTKIAAIFVVLAVGVAIAELAFIVRPIALGAGGVASISLILAIILAVAPGLLVVVAIFCATQADAEFMREFMRDLPFIGKLLSKDPPTPPAAST